MSGKRTLSESSAGFQVIFERPDQPAPSLPAGEPAFRPRRYHTKSRNGCFNCKKRRIKCDEAAPACSHCWEKGLQCEYPPTRSSPQPPLSSLPSPTRQVSRSRQPSEGLGLSDPQLTAVLNEDDVPCDSVMQQGYHRSDVLDLLHHFVVPTDHLWIGSQYAQGLVQDHVRRNAANAPYLLYSALAFSAAHRQYLEPTSNKYRVAAPYHYQHSLRRYFDKLSVVLDGEDAESLFVSCQLHALLAFLNAASAQTGQPGIDLGWIRSMRGIRFITQSPQLIASLQRGRFSSMVRSAAHDWEEVCEQEQFDNDPRVAVDLHHSNILQGLCANSHRDHRESLLHSIGMLRDLAQLKPEPAVIGTFMIWINRQPSTFIDLLEISDPIALLTLGLWCALFSRIDEWWIVGPARAECQTVCEHVDSLRDSRYDRVLAYLRSFS